jgi:hypothetical protein
MNETKSTESDTNTTEKEPVVAAEQAAPTAETVRAVEGEGRVDIEEVLPDSLKQGREGATRQEHPAGEMFFRGSAEEVTDAEAEDMARKQLERSGLLRGQRVRVAD